MAQKTSVVRNRITIDDRTYDARVLGGGKFNVFDAAGVRIGMFSVRGRAVEAEDLAIEGADPVEQIGLLWVRENLSAKPDPKAPETKIAQAPPPEVKPEVKAEVKPVAKPGVKPTEVGAIAAGPVTQAVEPGPSEALPTEAKGARPKSICRIATHDKPDAFSLQRGIAYQVWLKTQPGVLAAYLAQDPDNGKAVSVTIWENRERLAAMRYAKPPAGAVQLKAVSVELSWILE